MLENTFSLDAAHRMKLCHVLTHPQNGKGDECGDDCLSRPEKITDSSDYHTEDLLTHLSLASHKKDTGKQCIPRSDAAEYGV